MPPPPPPRHPPASPPPESAGPGPFGIARRAVLGAGLFIAAAAAGSALGFKHPVQHRVSEPPPAPPVVLTTLLSAHNRLLLDCGTLAAQPAVAGTLAPLQSDLRAHQAALRAVLETYPGWRFEQAAAESSSPGPVGADPSTSASLPTPVTLATVTAAVSAQAGQLASACLQWPAAGSAPSSVGTGTGSEVVGLLGSMSACLTVHVSRLS